MRTRIGAHRGVSLIEALIALAIMAFGMLGIIGVQSTLRFNSDIAKQRSEAVRLAQQSIEDSRSFMLVSPLGGSFTYSDIGALNQAIAGFTTNTTYTLTRDVVASGDTGDSDDPRLKTLRVTVSWADRTSANQSVELNTAIARLMPELGGTLALAANVGANGVPTRIPMPSGRNLNIPVQAVDFGNGTSGYIPPGRPGGDQTAWLFSNVTGVITFCTTGLLDNTALANYAATHPAAPDPFVCNGSPGLLLSGYVAFASDGTVAHALIPDGAAVATGVAVDVTFPAASTVNCYSQAPQGAYVAYFCAIPISAASNPPSVWSGSSRLLALPGAPQVCRYTTTVVPVRNSEHPLAYANVATALSQQNFLVIPAGDLCPGVLAGNSTAVSP
jgi:type II secretory pathway pseudopilin PulG